MLRRGFVLFLALLFGALPLAATPSVEALLRGVDELMRSKSSNAKIEMEVITPHWSRTMKMEVWTKGMDYTFIAINAPAKDKGVNSLKRQREMWNFFPKINKVIKVPPSMMMGSWMGSDFTNDDLVRETSLAEDYDATLTGAQGQNYAIKLIPKKSTVSLWGKIELIIDKASSLPVIQVFYDEKGVRVRELHFKEVRSLGGRTIPTVMELVPLTKKGHRTTVRYVSATFDQNISESVFTRTNLQRRR